MSCLRKLICSVFAFLILISPALAADVTLDMSPWLTWGPVPVTETESDLLKSDETVLKFGHLDFNRIIPEEGRPVYWGHTFRASWERYSGNTIARKERALVYFATYLNNKRWVKARLRLLNVKYGFIVTLDGKALKTSRINESWYSDVILEKGRHLLVVKALVSDDHPVRFRAQLLWDKQYGTGPLEVTLNRMEKMTTRHVLNTVNCRGIRVSPNGRLAALRMAKVQAKTGKSENWLEIVRTADGRTVYSSRSAGQVKGFKWLADSSAFSYYLRRGKKTSVWTMNLNDFKSRKIASDIKGFSNYWWAPDNSYFVYARTREQADSPEVKMIRELPERSAYPESRTALFMYFVKNGVTRQISDSKQNFSRVEISPDSSRAVLIRDVPDYSQRPYHLFEARVFDVASFSINPLFSEFWVNDVAWAPDSRRLLVLAGASAFKHSGSILSEGKLPNDFDGQAYIFDLKSKKTRAISRGFVPSIDSASWNLRNSSIYFSVTDGTRVGIYSFREKSAVFKKVNLPAEVIERAGFAKERPVAVCWISGSARPPRLFRVDLHSGSAKMIRDFNREDFARVQLGRVENWDYKTADGSVVPGRLYYPPDFQADKKYPCIVYYYGGTSPVTRDFAGRYPKNWYAAQGYMVYVLQPTGTVGYGQEKSAVHVNDWGKKTSQEIIAAVKDLTRKHPNVDPQKIGAMGASYGGFLTQYLGTQTNIFAALISHAGISSLASYWGVGDWGYLYSGVASADSFPWNRKELYVGHSPLFMAERIQTPLLLLHGDSDNNVPPGESYQMYAALKLLKKKAALITFRGQQHFIMKYSQRVRWMKTIIAWFDLWLKDQPQEWQHMYPEN